MPRALPTLAAFKNAAKRQNTTVEDEQKRWAVLEIARTIAGSSLAEHTAMWGSLPLLIAAQHAPRLPLAPRIPGDVDLVVSRTISDEALQATLHAVVENRFGEAATMVGDNIVFPALEDLAVEVERADGAYRFAYVPVANPTDDAAIPAPVPTVTVDELAAFKLRRALTKGAPKDLYDLAVAFALGADPAFVRFRTRDVHDDTRASELVARFRSLDDRVPLAKIERVDEALDILVNGLRECGLHIDAVDTPPEPSREALQDFAKWFSARPPAELHLAGNVPTI